MKRRNIVITEPKKEVLETKPICVGKVPGNYKTEKTTNDGYIEGTLYSTAAMSPGGARSDMLLVTLPIQDQRSASTMRNETQFNYK